MNGGETQHLYTAGVRKVTSSSEGHEMGQPDPLHTGNPRLDYLG